MCNLRDKLEYMANRCDSRNSKLNKISHKYIATICDIAIGAKNRLSFLQRKQWYISLTNDMKNLQTNYYGTPIPKFSLCYNWKANKICANFWNSETQFNAV